MEEEKTMEEKNTMEEAGMNQMNHLTMAWSAELMLSGDYRERMAAEWAQVKIRLRRLQDMLDAYRDGKLDFELTCPITLLREQALVMQEYVDIMEKRAELEGIRLEAYFQ